MQHLQKRQSLFQFLQFKMCIFVFFKAQVIAIMLNEYNNKMKNSTGKLVKYTKFTHQAQVEKKLTLDTVSVRDHNSNQNIEYLKRQGGGISIY